MKPSRHAAQHSRECMLELKFRRRAADAGVAQFGSTQLCECAMSWSHIFSDEARTGAVHPPTPDGFRLVPENEIIVESELGTPSERGEWQEFPGHSLRHTRVQVPAQNPRNLTRGPQPPHGLRHRAGTAGRRTG